VSKRLSLQSHVKHTPLHTEIAKATAMPDAKARLETFGMEPASAGPSQFAAHIHSEMQRWGKLVRDAGVKAVLLRPHRRCTLLF
jgi:tripartite-type tricarboxylate transporter receptor subunit TctC